MDVSLEGLRVVQAADEEQFLAEVGQRREHPAEFHLLSIALGPPLLAVKAVPRKQHRQPYRRLTAWLGGFGGFLAPHGEGLHPRQRHGDPRATQESATREVMRLHEWPSERGRSSSGQP